MKYSLNGGRNGTQIGDGRGSKPRQLSIPNAVVVDEENNLVYISDYGNNRIQLWNEGGLGVNVETVIKKPISSGNGTINFFQADDIQLDPRSNDILYILDSQLKHVFKWELPTTHAEKIAPILPGAVGIHVDAQQNIFEANCAQHRIIHRPKYRILAGTGQRGNKLNQLDCPSAVVVDSGGNMFIADTDNHRIMFWEMNTKEGICIVGCSITRGTQADQLALPKDVIFDWQGNLLVADTENHRVQRFDTFINQSCGKYIAQLLPNERGIIRVFTH